MEKQLLKNLSPVYIQGGNEQARATTMKQGTFFGHRWIYCEEMLESKIFYEAKEREREKSSDEENEKFPNPYL